MSKKPTQEEINEVIHWATKAEATGQSDYPGMSYEEGVRAGIDWVLGDTDERPDE